MTVSGVVGQPGETASIRVRVADPDAVKGVSVNGLEQPFTRTPGEVCLKLQFAGEKFAGWQTPEGKRNGSYRYHNFIGERPSQLWLDGSACPRL